MEQKRANLQVKRRVPNKKEPIAKRKLGEILVETGLLTKDELMEALQSQRESGKRLGQILVDKNLISEEEMAFALAMQLKIPYVDLSNHEIPQSVIDTIPEEVSRKFICIPVSLRNNVLDVAMADPLDLNIVKDLQFITGYNVQPAISTATQIIEYLQEHYHPEKTISEVADEIGTEDIMEFLPEREEQEEEDRFEEMKDSPFVKMVDLVIKNAIKKGASDVHIEAQENQVRVRNRIDGVLQDSIKLPKWTQPIIISRIKVLGGMDIAEKRLPQDGRIKVRSKNISVDLRVSTLPTYYGEKAVIRILNKEATFLSIGDLGFSPKNLDLVKGFIKQPQGLVLITGPTGSGKTSTLYGCLKGVMSDEVNIVTVEDPVEYELPGINQVQINEKVGLTFPFVLRSILRQDPNVIMIGEIRDMETAEIALQASMTGHLVLATLHTNDAPSAITRLVDIGLAPYLISSSLIGIIAQRLVRKVCPECKEEYTPNPELLGRLGLDKRNLPFKFYKGAGCSRCNNLGFKGRTIIEEVMAVGRQIRDLIQSGATTDKLRDAAMATGMTTLGQSGLQLIESGITTIDEVLKAVQEKDELTSICPHCGKGVSLDFKDCPYCKKPLLLTCENCGRITQPEWVVCPYCRRDLKDSA
ncbi:MAG: Flp pilus assembly complex ATPase component TadA [Deltaproteobacteria bacterium]|nr:Flp pilus assembly complex ATPase component TadA [Deltaproteobacteria bacterium]MBW2138798.1 Flp pilus assembly complex ATPase component TadA [Deltaproteobacteria bacterium]